MKPIEINIMDLAGWVLKAKRQAKQGRIARAIQTLRFVARHPYFSADARMELRTIAWLLKQRTAYDKLAAFDRMDCFVNPDCR